MSELFSYTDSETKILKSFVNINTNIIIQNDRFAVSNNERSVIGTYKFDTPYSYDEYGIFDLSTYLTTLNSMSDPSLDVTENSVEINDTANKVKAIYTTTPLDLLQSVPDVTERFAACDIVQKFTLSAEKLAIIQKLAGIHGHVRLYVESTEAGVLLLAAQKSLRDKENPSEIMVTGDDVELNDLEGIKYFKFTDLKILEGEYSVQISSAGFSRWYNETLSVEYFIGSGTYHERD